MTPAVLAGEQPGAAPGRYTPAAMAGTTAVRSTRHER